MKITYTVLVAFCFLGALASGKEFQANEGHLPPLGERLYVIPTFAAGPVSIKDASESGAEAGEQSRTRVSGVIMRDPLPPGNQDDKILNIKIADEKRSESSRRKQQARTAESQTRLGLLEIQGRVAAPQVKFTRERLEIGQVDENFNPLSEPGAALDKIREDANSDYF